MNKIIAIVIVLFSLTAHAVEHTYTVLVYRDRITTAQWNVARAKGYVTLDDAIRNGGQPFRRTTYSEIMPNIIRLDITCKDLTEKNFFSAFEAAGYGKLISEWWVENNELKHRTYGEFPAFEVNKSTK